VRQSLEFMKPYTKNNDYISDDAQKPVLIASYVREMDRYNRKV